MGIKKRKNQRKGKNISNNLLRKNKKNIKKQNKVLNPLPGIWDTSKSLRENYKNIGIILDLNLKKDLNKIKDIKVNQVVSNNHGLEYLHNLAEIDKKKKIEKKKDPKLDLNEELVLKRLIRKHKDNLSNMRNDIKWNKFVWEESQIKKKLEIYNKSKITN